MTTRDDPQAGFALLEVLVAFALLVAVASALMGAFVVAVRGDGRAAFDTRGTLLAQSLLAAVGVETPLAPGATTGRLANGTVWRTDVSPDRAVPDGGGRMLTGYWVMVTVFDPDSGGRRRVSLTSYEIDRGAGTPR